MKHSETLMGKPFGYEGSLGTGLVVHAGSSVISIAAASIVFVRNEIEHRSPVLMGASRNPLVKGSLGESLRLETGKSPQFLSYVVPLLVEEGFCRVTPSRPYLITRCSRYDIA